MLLLLAVVMWRIHMYNGGWKYVVTLLAMGSYARLTMVILDLQHSALRRACFGCKGGRLAGRYGQAESKARTKIVSMNFRGILSDRIS